MPLLESSYMIVSFVFTVSKCTKMHLHNVFKEEKVKKTCFTMGKLRIFLLIECKSILSQIKKSTLLLHKLAMHKFQVYICISL